MGLSKEESEGVLKVLRKSLRGTEKDIKKMSSEIKKAKSKISIDDEFNMQRIKKFEEKLNHAEALYNVKLRFVESMENTSEDVEMIIGTDIKTVQTG